MKNDIFEKEYIEKPKRSNFLPSVSASRLRGFRTAGLFMLFICLLFSFIIGFGLHRSDNKTLTASAADDWGATWNTAVTASTSTSPQTVKLTSAWTTTTGTKTGSGFSS
ncbi:MAG: hypothetical protein K2J30_00705, partial [Clostridia bacterium]|nr:hypothetical protein [Clostridia bacterium]